MEHLIGAIVLLKRGTLALGRMEKNHKNPGLMLGEVKTSSLISYIFHKGGF